jgi:hypothetical protein
MQYADLPDVEAMCKHVLDSSLRAAGMPHVDYDNALGQLRLAAWHLYLGWKPEMNVRFTAYASGLLPKRFTDWQRRQIGRDTPKAHAFAISLDAPAGEDDADLLSYLAAVGGDPSDRDQDLDRVLRPLLEGGLGEALSSRS